jgi:hypothetical protein
MRTLTSVLVLLPLLVGVQNPCPEPNYPPLADCPFPADPSLVTGKLLGWVRVELGGELIHTRTWCEPDGNPADVEIVSGPDGLELIERTKTHSYTLLWRPKEPGVVPIVVRVTDRPRRGQPLSDTGTILVQVVSSAKRPAASPCGGQPR